MARDDKNRRSASTTYVWRKVKISGGAPEGPAPKAAAKRWSGLARRDAKQPLTITLHHRGGAESWWVIQARGRTAAVPGHRALDDVMAELNRTWSHPEK